MRPLTSAATWDDLQWPGWSNSWVCDATGVSICVGTNAEALAVLDEDWEAPSLSGGALTVSLRFSLVEATAMSGVRLGKGASGPTAISMASAGARGQMPGREGLTSRQGGTAEGGGPPPGCATVTDRCQPARTSRCQGEGSRSR
jgi:hypothetical protein